MKLAVFGQRAIVNEEEVITRFEELDYKEDLVNECTTYLHGGAKGPQRIILSLFEDHDTVLFLPWSLVTNKLGEFNADLFNYRNKQIIDNADDVVIFDDGSPDREADYVLHYVRRSRKHYYLIKM